MKKLACVCFGFLLSSVLLAASETKTTDKKIWNWKLKDENTYNYINFNLSAFEKENGKWSAVWSNSFTHSSDEKKKECDASIFLEDKKFYLKTELVKKCPMGSLNEININSMIFTNPNGEGLKTDKGYIIAYRPAERNEGTDKIKDMDFFVVLKIEFKNQE